MLKKLFIPHHGNDYKPHLLHHKRVWFYGLFLIILKIIITTSVLLLPEIAWLSGDALARQEERIAILTNEKRTKNNLPALSQNALLVESANLKARDMNKNNYFSHTNKSGQGLDYYLQQVGYEYNFAGENLAVGFVDASAVMRAWKKSPTHFANLVDKDFKQMGVGMVSGEYQGAPAAFIVSHFGAPAIRAALIQNVSTVAGVKIPTASVIENIFDKYLSAKNTFSDWFYGEFEFASYIYYIFLGIFTFTLFTTIFIEIKRQHPHLIINGLGIIALIVLLIKI